MIYKSKFSNTDTYDWFCGPGSQMRMPEWKQKSCAKDEPTYSSPKVIYSFLHKADKYNKALETI